MATEADQGQENFNRLRLIRSKNVGPVSYNHLIQRFGSAGNALLALPELTARGGGRAPKIAAEKDIADEISLANRTNASFLFLGDTNYPSLLSELNNAPPVLIWRGDLKHLHSPAVAVIGARNASAAACRFARDLANNLSAENVSVVSGLARGIDTAAHQGSLNTSTIGVIAGGIDIYYPPENQDLQEQIAEKGLLLSEQPPQTEPRARHFPYRNRIIAGLSRGTVVVEAAPRSGSLITARLANEAGRQVMAVPGSPLDPRSRGCNNLIREGATLVQSAEDVIEMVRHFDERAETSNDLFGGSNSSNQNGDLRETREDLSHEERSDLHGLLSITPVSIDEIVRQSGLSPSAVQLALLELELAGRLDRHAGAKVSLKS